jgi:two-component system, OmpR family, sensor histidine kinase KdpD
VHDPTPRRSSTAPRGGEYRVRIEAAGAALGSIRALRRRHAGEPDPTATRLLAAAADQVGQALAQDHLAGDARRAEIARQGDAIKSALVESVSHDLRTPLASIRAAAGTLMDPEIRLSREDAQATAALIDGEVERLNRVVTNLLDLGRIEGGALRASHEVVELDDFVTRTVNRVAQHADGRSFEIDVDPAEVVRGDPVLLEEAFLNVLENAARHTPNGTRVRVAARHLDAEPFVRLTVEDSGSGVPADALPRLFEKFYRVPQRGSGSWGGTGIGLAVVRGLTAAMGGRVSARRSELGGLAVDLDLPAAVLPASLPSD